MKGEELGARPSKKQSYNNFIVHKLIIFWTFKDSAALQRSSSPRHARCFISLEKEFITSKNNFNETISPL